ncbi:hypothetical protein MMPV_001802 [Pyropia vietnamensis]
MAAEWPDEFDPRRPPPELAPLLEPDLPPVVDCDGSGPLLLPPFPSMPPFRDPMEDLLAVPPGRFPATDWAATSLPLAAGAAAPVTAAVDEGEMTRVAVAPPPAAAVPAVSASMAAVPMPVVAPAAGQVRVGAPRLGVATPPSVSDASGAGGRATKKRRPPAPSALQLAAAQADAVRERFKAANKAAAAAAAAAAATAVTASPAAASVAAAVQGGRHGTGRSQDGVASGVCGASSGGATSTATSAATIDAGAGAVPSFASSVSGGDGGGGVRAGSGGRGGCGSSGGDPPANGDATNAAKYERRLKMNRASAAASRLRHKTYIQALETSVKAATAKNEEMIARLEQAWEENAALKARLEVALSGGAPLPPSPPPPPLHRVQPSPGVVQGGEGAAAGGEVPHDVPAGAFCFS